MRLKKVSPKKNLEKGENRYLRKDYFISLSIYSSDISRICMKPVNHQSAVLMLMFYYVIWQVVWDTAESSILGDWSQVHFLTHIPRFGFLYIRQSQVSLIKRCYLHWSCCIPFQVWVIYLFYLICKQHTSHWLWSLSDFYMHFMGYSSKFSPGLKPMKYHMN